MNFLKGYKTKIGMALVLIAQAGRAFAPDLAPWEIVEQLGMLIGGVGLAAAGADATMTKLKTPK